MPVRVPPGPDHRGRELLHLPAGVRARAGRVRAHPPGLRGVGRRVAGGGEGTVQRDAGPPAARLGRRPRRGPSARVRRRAGRPAPAFHPAPPPRGGRHDLGPAGNHDRRRSSASTAARAAGAIGAAGTASARRAAASRARTVRWSSRRRSGHAAREPSSVTRGRPSRHPRLQAALDVVARRSRAPGASARRTSLRLPTVHTTATGAAGIEVLLAASARAVEAARGPSPRRVRRPTRRARARRGSGCRRGGRRPPGARSAPRSWPRC